nr:unnamed protein product [Callosobruchus analis]
MHPNSANPAPVGMKRAARAALILIPLFGLQFILLPMIPEQHHPLYHFYIWLCLIIVPFQVSRSIDLVRSETIIDITVVQLRRNIYMLVLIIYYHS